MPPMTTHSTCQTTTAPRGRRTKERTGRGGGRAGNQVVQGGDQGVKANRGVDGVLDFSTIIVRQLQNLLPTIITQVGNHVNNQGNNGNRDVHDMSGCGANQKFKYIVGSLIGKALTWRKTQVQTRGRDVAVGMSWEDFKVLMRDELCPDNEVQKLEFEFWCHAMVEACHAAYTNRFHELARSAPHLVTPEKKRIERYIYGLAPQIHGMVAATEPTTIQSAVLKARMLHLSDHRPILLREVITDYGATPFQIRAWVADQKKKQPGCVNDLKSELSDIDKTLDQGVNDDLLLSRMECMKQLHDVESADARDSMQKAKIQWAIEGDENSKFFHGVINIKRTNLAVKGIMIDGEWVDDPSRVKDEFRTHFAARFQDLGICHGRINFSFPNRLNLQQATDLENPITRDEIRNAVWGCGENKSPGPDGFTFELFRCNSSFIALILKSLYPKSVSDYRPISLIRSLYKVVTKILATRLLTIISDLISDVQTAFLPNRQILDGPFIINELLARCHHKKQRAMVFKVDFANAYDSIRWDYLEDVLKYFGFGSKWSRDPLAPYLFILIMESLHLSFSRVIDAGIFTGVRIDSSLMISHLFYADDAIFIGEWSHDNLKGIMHMLHYFSLMSGLSISLKKSHLLGVGILASCVHEAATSLGCSVMKAPFKYLRIMVGGNMSLVKAWDDTVDKLKGRLSKWKLKTLSNGSLLTLLKSVLGSTPIYNMFLYKVPKTVLNSMEAIRRKFFNGIHDDERKVAWVKWSKELSASHSSTWSSILKEISILKAQGVDLISHCKIRVGNGLSTSFWNDLWIGDAHLRYMFPLLYALDSNKECTMADKMNAPLTFSFRRTVRGGAESLQLAHLLDLLGPVILSNMEDQWISNMNGDGVFRVKDVRILLDEVFLPNDATPTRWIKSIAIKVNVFAWKVSLDRLPTRSNMSKRGVVVPSLSCPICNLIHEDTSHLLFSCGLASEVMRLVCRWWNLVWIPLNSYPGWLSWFKSL
nr:RNA-directed DNA polymerase, eukaryota [Tanacetum cinerariifolium]